MRTLFTSQKSFVASELLVPLFLALTALTAHADEPQKATETGLGRITGQVLFDKDGQAAPDSKVILLAPPPEGKKNYDGQKLPLRETTADAEGRFAFDSLPIGKYQVWANLGKLTSRKKYRSGVTVEIVDGAEPPKPIELRLVDGVTITARVLDKATGKLIPNAVLNPQRSDFFEGNFKADGSNPIVAQPFTREHCWIEVWADGFAKEMRLFNLENGTDLYEEFQLIPGADLEGTVRDPDGNPVEGVGLSARIEGENRQHFYVESDKQGKYRLDRVPANRNLSVYVSKVDWVRQTLTVRVAEPNQRLNVTMQPRPHGGTIIGVVQDASGHPIADATLTNYGNSSNEKRETKTGADGKFKLDNLFTSQFGNEVIVRAKNCAPKRTTVEPGPKDMPAEITIEMEPGHTIKGLVTDEDGHALDGVTIYVANGNHAFSMGSQAKTDKEGRFEFDSLPADCPFSFQTKGFSNINNEKLTLDTDEIIKVVMIPTGMIVGNVKDQVTGKPIRSFNVRITFSPLPQPGDPSGSLNPEWIKPGRKFQSDSGNFKLSDLVAGMPFQVMIDAEGYETTTEQRVEAVRSDDPTEVEFELLPIDPKSLRSYRGQLLDAKQKPVAGAELRLIAYDQANQIQARQRHFNWWMIKSGQTASQFGVVRFLEGVTDKEGRFEFTKVPKDIETELVWWGGKVVAGRSEHVEDWDENKITVINVPEPAAIKGIIDRTKFPPIGSVSLGWQTIEPEDSYLELKPDQQDFEFENLTPGQYTIQLMSPYERVQGQFDGQMRNHQIASITVTVEEGEVQQVKFGEEEAPQN